MKEHKIMQTKKTIYLHIGMPKSGSTSIQTFLYEKADELSEKYDIFYPLTDNHSDNTINGKINYREIMLEAYYKKKGNIKSYNKFFEDNFLPKILENKCNKIIFSEEFIFMCCRDTKITDIFIKHGFNVKIIVYLRKPYEYIATLWQENLKPYMDNFHYSVEDFAQITDINYDLILKFIEKLGRENVLVRPFEKAQWKNENLIEDFFETAGVKNFGNVNFPVQNSSYNRNLAEFMLLLKGTGISRNKLVKLLKDNIEIFVKSENNPNIDNMNDFDLTELIGKNTSNNPKIADTLSDKFIENLNNRYSEIIKQISQIYGKESIFLNKYPDYYGKERAEYDSLTLSYEQLNLLHKAMSL